MTTTSKYDQPAPIMNDRPPLWSIVIESIGFRRTYFNDDELVNSVIDDMVERSKVGYERYGTHLQAFNGRNAIVDAYQEALDLCVYLRQALEECFEDETDDDAEKIDNLYCLFENTLETIMSLKKMMGVTIGNSDE